MYDAEKADLESQSSALEQVSMGIRCAWTSPNQQRCTDRWKSPSLSQTLRYKPDSSRKKILSSVLNRDWRVYFFGRRVQIQLHEDLLQ